MLKECVSAPANHIPVLTENQDEQNQKLVSEVQEIVIGTKSLIPPTKWVIKALLKSVFMALRVQSTLSGESKRNHKIKAPCVLPLARHGLRISRANLNLRINSCQVMFKRAFRTSLYVPLAAFRGNNYFQLDT